MSGRWSAFCPAECRAVLCDHTLRAGLKVTRKRRLCTASLGRRCYSRRPSSAAAASGLLWRHADRCLSPSRREPLPESSLQRRTTLPKATGTPPSCMKRTYDVRVRPSPSPRLQLTPTVTSSSCWCGSDPHRFQVFLCSSWPLI